MGQIEVLGVALQFAAVLQLGRMARNFLRALCCRQFAHKCHVGRTFDVLLAHQVESVGRLDHIE